MLARWIWRFSRRRKPLEAHVGLEPASEATWKRARRVVAKAEHLDKGANPRFGSHLAACRTVSGKPCMKSFIVRAGKWRTASRNSNWRCSPTALLRSNQTAAILFHLRLSTDAGVTAARFKRHRDGPGTVPDDPSAAAQNRSTDPGNRAARLCAQPTLEILSPARGVRGTCGSIANRPSF